MDRCSNHHLKTPSRRLENISEENEGWLPAALRPPDTPTETMEFLARSWSITAVDLCKALADNNASLAQPRVEADRAHRPISSSDHRDMKQPQRGKAIVGWLKDQKEKKRAEARSRSAHAHAAAAVAGVAAAVAAVAAGSVFAADHVLEGQSMTTSGGGSRVTAAVASAAALVASHCVEMAQVMGASREQILKVVQSAVAAQTAGDIWTLTAGAATALRGAAALRRGCHNEIQGTFFSRESKESNVCLSASAFVCNGGELLKRTRKGILHRKQVSVYINSHWQVVLKMKSTHIAGTFVKKKKGVILDVSADIEEWPGRETEDGSHRRSYFGIRTQERLIEFECSNKGEKLLWVEGIQQMLNRFVKTSDAMAM